MGADFDELCHNIAMDARVPPPKTSSEMKSCYDRYVLADRSYEVKGDFMKQSSWYSIVKMIDQHEGSWHSRKYFGEQIAAHFIQGPDAKKKVDGVAKEVMEFMTNCRSTSGGQGGKVSYLDDASVA